MRSAIAIHSRANSKRCSRSCGSSLQRAASRWHSSANSMQSFWDAITPTRDSKPDAAWSRRPALLGARWSTPPLTLVPLGYGARPCGGNEVVSHCKMRGRTSSSKMELMPRLGWSAPLTRPIQVKDGTTLRTLNDARAYMLDHLPEDGPGAAFLAEGRRVASRRGRWLGRRRRRDRAGRACDIPAGPSWCRKGLKEEDQ